MSGEEKNILYWADHRRKGRTKISCTGTTSPTNQHKKDGSLSYCMYSWSPHLPQFQQSATTTPKSLSGRHQTLFLIKGPTMDHIMATTLHNVWVSGTSLRTERRQGPTRVPGHACLAWRSSWRIVVNIYFLTAAGKSAVEQLLSGNRGIRYGKGRRYGPSIAHNSWRFSQPTGVRSHSVKCKRYILRTVVLRSRVSLHS